MNQSKQSPRTAFSAIAIFLGLVIVSAVFCTSIRMVGRLDWNTWANNVHIACQEGSNAKTVRLLLGDPSIIQTKDDPVAPWKPPVPTDVKDAEQVLVYSKAFPGRGFWITHIYLDKDGKVIAYHIGKS